jgi:hypothetical protein
MIIGRKNMVHRKFLLVAAVALIFTALFLNTAVFAAESREAQEQNEVGLFLGGSHHSHENGFSVGLDYEHRISDMFGVGGLVEYTTEDFDSWDCVCSQLRGSRTGRARISSLFVPA